MEKKNKQSELVNIAISSGLYETTQRYGQANAEFLKGLRGVDNITGDIFDRSLSKIHKYKISNENNINQQAGFSAEVASVAKKNAEAIIEGKLNRFARSEDIAKYGKNHNTIDIVELIGENEISTSQMKFVSNPDELLRKIACGEGEGKNNLSRYLDADKLEVPTDQVKHMKKRCRDEASNLRQQAQYVKGNGNLELAEKLSKHADNYEILETKITDSGITAQEAIEYRLHPEFSTLKDIGKVSHKAGIEGAKFGMVIGGSISLVTNIISVYSQDKNFNEAVLDIATTTATSAGVGYLTSFSGSAITAFMQQSQLGVIRDLSKTNIPAIVISTCLATSQSIKKYIINEIEAEELFEELGQTAVSNLSSTGFAAIGQLAIPIPVLGGLIGGMVGYAISNIFYAGYLDALKLAKKSQEDYTFIKMKCDASNKLNKQYEAVIDEIFVKKISQIDNESKILFEQIKSIRDISADDYFEAMNSFAKVVGKNLGFNNMQEFDSAMLSKDPLKF